MTPTTDGREGGKVFRLLAVLAFVACLGCAKPSVVSSDSVGVIVDAEVVPTSFNESLKMRIKTERAIVVIHAVTSVDLGRDAWITKWSDGRRTFTWAGATRNYDITP